MKHDARLSRRRFLGAAAALAAPYVVPAAALGKDGAAPANDRIAMGCIGPGGRGSANVSAFLASSETQVVAVCDEDADRMLARPCREPWTL